MKIHHSGILTNDILVAKKYYNNIGFKTFSKIINCRFQKVKIIFLKKKNINRLIEIILFDKGNKSLKNFFLRKNNNFRKPFFKYHDCFYVKKNYELLINNYLKNNNYKLLIKDKSEIFNKFCFFQKKNRKHLIEIVSEPKKKYMFLVK